MALEDLIRLHTEALVQNTEAVKALTASLAGGVPAKTEAAKDEKLVKKESVAKAEKAPKEDVKAQPKEEPKTTVEETVNGVMYEVVRNLVLKLAPTHRETIKEINTKHGLGTLKDLLDDHNDFTTVNDQAKLDAVFEDLKALEA